jgi:hypothetical protein
MTRNRIALRKAARKLRVRRMFSPFTGSVCSRCGSYARMVRLGGHRETQVICNNDNRHRR